MQRPPEAAEGAPPRIGRPLRAATSEAILTTTVRLLAEGGYARLTIDRVADLAGVSRASILRRFPRKVDLVIELCRTINATELPLPDTGDIVNDLMQHFNGYISTGPSWRSPLLRAFIAESFTNRELSDALHSAYFLPRRQRITEIIERALARGELMANVDAGIVADMISGFSWHRRVASGLQLDRTATLQFIDVLLTGIRSSKSIRLD